MTTVQKVAEAFVAGKSAKCGNASTDGVIYRLHGNAIAVRAENDVTFDWCNWYTPTTANHMNAILKAMGSNAGDKPPQVGLD